MKVPWGEGGGRSAAYCRVNEEAEDEGAIDDVDREEAIGRSKDKSKELL